jgi:hypothetical protein
VPEHPIGENNGANRLFEDFAGLNFKTFPSKNMPLNAKNTGTRKDSGIILYGVDNGTRTHDLQSHNLTP